MFKADIVNISLSVWPVMSLTFWKTKNIYVPKMYFWHLSLPGKSGQTKPSFGIFSQLPLPLLPKFRPEGHVEPLPYQTIVHMTQWESPTARNNFHIITCFNLYYNYIFLHWTSLLEYSRWQHNLKVPNV